MRALHKENPTLHRTLSSIGGINAGNRKLERKRNEEVQRIHERVRRLTEERKNLIRKMVDSDPDLELFPVVGYLERLNEELRMTEAMMDGK